MTKEELAATLDGVEYPAPELGTMEPSARQAGLVIAIGESDDILSFMGALYEECEANDGVTVPCGSDGLLVNHCDEGVRCPYYAAIEKEAPHWVRAEWCPEDDPGTSWRITASVPVASFSIMEGSDVFCRGIVFEMAALAEAPTTQQEESA